MDAEWLRRDEHGGVIMALADRVKALRVERGWSQTDLASQIGAAPAQVSRYESGRTAPSADTVIRLAETFGVSCDYLLVDDAPRTALPLRRRHPRRPPGIGRRTRRRRPRPRAVLHRRTGHQDPAQAPHRADQLASTLPARPGHRPARTALIILMHRCVAERGPTRNGRAGSQAISAIDAARQQEQAGRPQQERAAQEAGKVIREARDLRAARTMRSGGANAQRSVITRNLGHRACVQALQPPPPDATPCQPAKSTFVNFGKSGDH
jgi:transcriptional regulator with XRE-family HTH domain